MPRLRDREPDDKPEPQPKRPYDHLRDYFTLLRFRMNFGAKNNPSNYWGKK